MARPKRAATLIQTALQTRASLSWIWCARAVEDAEVETQNGDYKKAKDDPEDGFVCHRTIGVMIAQTG